MLHEKIGGKVFFGKLGEKLNIIIQHFVDILLVISQMQTYNIHLSY